MRCVYIAPIFKTGTNGWIQLPEHQPLIEFYVLPSASTSTEGYGFPLSCVVFANHVWLPRKSAKFRDQTVWYQKSVAFEW